MNEEDQTPFPPTSSSYKQRHEDFVSDLTGGPIGEICQVTAVAAVGYFTWSVLHTRGTNAPENAGIASQMADFVLNWLAIFLAVTIYSGDLITLHFLLLVPAIVVLMLKKRTEPIASVIGGRSTRSEDVGGAVQKAQAQNGDAYPVPGESVGKSSDSTSSGTTSGVSMSSPATVESVKTKAKAKANAFSTTTTVDDSRRVRSATLLPRKPFLTVYRSSMMVVTCIAILAVDFPIFPRRFAKVETWGTSLMDMGVGAFVFSMGLVSAREPLRESLKNTKTSVMRSLLTSLKHAGPVLLLGFARLFFVKYFDYQEHVTEYGVHWNFFMTLGLLPPFVAVFGALQPRVIPTGLLALIFTSLYEYALSHTNLRAFILVSPRENFFSQNREGIFSFIGYFSIFLVGRSTGFFTLPLHVEWKNILYMPQLKKQTEEPKQDSRPKVLMMLIISTVVHSSLLYLVLQHLTPSRRIANLPYVLFVISFNTGMIAILVTVDLMFYPAPSSAKFNYMNCVPFSLEAVNYNGLAVFLLANVTTGLINMNVHTLDTTVPQSLAILISYLLFLYLTSIYLYNKGIRIKI